MADGLLLDLDDTLYDYAPAAAAGEQAVFRKLEDLGLPDAPGAWGRARLAVKARTRGTGASHAPLLYLAELVARAHRPEWLADCRGLDAAYWDAFLAAARLREGARALIDGFRARGGRVALVTDLTLTVQLRKLAAFDLLDAVDALVTSEESGADKPDPCGCRLAAERLGVPVDACVLLGDSLERDGECARRLGVPFLHARGSTGGGGHSLPELSARL